MRRYHTKTTSALRSEKMDKNSNSITVLGSGYSASKTSLFAGYQDEPTLEFFARSHVMGSGSAISLADILSHKSIRKTRK